MSIRNTQHHQVHMTICQIVNDLWKSNFQIPIIIIDEKKYYRTLKHPVEFMYY